MKKILVSGQVTDLPISKLLPDPEQPRKHFDENALEELASSMQVRVLVPLLVRPNGASGKFIILDGERRWRAAKLAKIKTLPVLLQDGDIDEAVVRAEQLTVNSQREGLQPMETARMLAQLRTKHFKTDNELAALLDKQGLPAMTKKQIGQAITLTNLPQWAQDMIDAGTLEPSAALKLTPHLQRAELLADIRQEIDRRIEWSGRATGNEVKSRIWMALRDHAEDLDRTESWNHNPVCFDPKTVCTGCEHLVQHDGKLFCMNREEFEKKNAEAKAAGFGPGGRKREGGDTAGAGAGQSDADREAQRARTLEEKARTYLHAHLVAFIVRHMRGDAEDHQIDITDELLAWHGMDRPGQGYMYGSQAGGLIEGYSGSHERQVKSIEQLLQSGDDDLASAKLCAAVEIAHGLYWREVQAICHDVWGQSITKVWKLDEPFLELFRKAELIHLAEQHNVNPPGGKAWNGLKVPDVRAAIIRQGEKVTEPAILADIYSDIAEPADPSWGLDGDLDD